MPDLTSDSDRLEFHRALAAAANDRAWTLSEKRELSRREQAELLHAAHAAAYHWSKAGGAGHTARADLLLGRVYALLGQGELATRFANAAFDEIMARESAAWERAFAHAVVANAAAASGSPVIHAEHYARARALAEHIPETEERDIFFATFDLIPRPGPS